MHTYIYTCTYIHTQHIYMYIYMCTCIHIYPCSTGTRTCSASRSAKCTARVHQSAPHRCAGWWANSHSLPCSITNHVCSGTLYPHLCHKKSHHTFEGTSVPYKCVSPCSRIPEIWKPRRFVGCDNMHTTLCSRIRKTFWYPNTRIDAIHMCSALQ